ncbi:MAG: type II toxin-antitoxin system HicB family antitoxin, partial [bacterium]
TVETALFARASPPAKWMAGEEEKSAGLSADFAFSCKTKLTEFEVREYKYTVIFEPAQEGGYVVHVPALNGLTTEGDTLEEAKAMALDAIRGYLVTLLERNLPIPEDIQQPEPLIERLAVALE